MDDLLTILSEHFVVVLVAGSILLALGLRTVTTIATTTSRERSRREIAAYIAEGSITPEHGERLIRADVNHGPGVP